MPEEPNRLCLSYRYRTCSVFPALAGTSIQSFCSLGAAIEARTPGRDSSPPFCYRSSKERRPVCCLQRSGDSRRACGGRERRSPHCRPQAPDEPCRSIPQIAQANQGMPSEVGPSCRSQVTCGRRQPLPELPVRFQVLVPKEDSLGIKPVGERLKSNSLEFVLTNVNDRVTRKPSEHFIDGANSNWSGRLLAVRYAFYQPSLFMAVSSQQSLPGNVLVRSLFVTFVETCDLPQLTFLTVASGVRETDPSVPNLDPIVTPGKMVLRVFPIPNVAEKCHQRLEIMPDNEVFGTGWTCHVDSQPFLPDSRTPSRLDSFAAVRITHSTAVVQQIQITRVATRKTEDEDRFIHVDRRREDKTGRVRS